MSITTFRTRGIVAVAAVAATVLVQQGQAAGTRPDDRAPARVPEIVSLKATPPDFVDRFIATHEASVSNPGVRVPEIVSLYAASVSPSVQRSTTTSRAEAFDWGAAGVGASTTTALLLALGIGIAIARRFRTDSAPA